MNRRLSWIVIILAWALAYGYYKSNIQRGPVKPQTVEATPSEHDDQARALAKQEKRERAEQERAANRAARKAAIAAEEAAQAAKRQRDREARAAKQEKQRLARTAKARADFIGTELDFMAVKGAAYRKVKVTAIDQTTMSIFHAEGAATIPLADLPSSVKSKIRYSDDEVMKSVASKPSTSKPANLSSEPQVATATANSATETYLAKILREYDTKRNLLYELETTISNRQSKADELQRRMNQTLVDSNDRVLWQRMTDNIASLIRKSAKLKGETDGLQMIVGASAQEYDALKDLFERYRQKSLAYHIADRNQRAANVQYSQRQNMQDLAGIKSFEVDESIAKFKKQVKALESLAEKRLIEIDALRTTLNKAREAFHKSRQQ